MVKISGGNARSEGWWPLQGQFRSRSKPFERPFGFDRLAALLRQKSLKMSAHFLHFSSSHSGQSLQTMILGMNGA